MKTLLFIAIALVFLATVLLAWAYRVLPARELRRRARAGHDKSAANLYKAASYGEGLEILFWLVGSLSAAYLIITAANYGWWLAVLLIVLLGFYFFVAQPGRQPGGWRWQAAAWVAPVAGVLLSTLQPVFAWAGGLLKDSRPAHGHSGLYEKEDLLELLKSQKAQPDNRFGELELAIIKGAMTFGDKTIGQVMSPRTKLKLVTPNEPVGPLLMDELHASGQAAYPVVKEASRSASLEVVGTLYLSDLVHYEGSGKVRELMRPQVYFINESQDLREALAAFIKTRAHLLVAVNNFEEVTGTLTIEQVLEQILGHKLATEFDRYDDLPSVAGHSQ